MVLVGVGGVNRVGRHGRAMLRMHGRQDDLQEQRQRAEQYLE